MESKLTLTIEATSNYGEVIVLINGVRYHYLIDAALIPEFRYLYSKSKGKSLAFLKKQSYDWWKGGDKDGRIR